MATLYCYIDNVMVNSFTLCFIMVILIFACLCGALFFFVQNTVIDLAVLEQYNPGKPTIVLDDKGDEWARFSLDKRLPISIKNMSPYLM